MKDISIFNKPIRKLLKSNYNFFSIKSITNQKRYARFIERKNVKKLWSVKYKQCLELEKSRIFIEDKEYLINYKDGF